MWLYGVRWAHFSCFQELMGRHSCSICAVDTLYCHEMGTDFNPRSAYLCVSYLYRHITIIGKEGFIAGFDKWCDEWKEFLDERTLLISCKTIYTHRRLRTARRSVKAHLKWFYRMKNIRNQRYPIRQIFWKDLTHNLKEHCIIIMG